MRHRFPIIFVGLLLTAGMLWLHESTWPMAQQWRQRLEGVGYDLRMQWFTPDAPATDERIVIVAIDEKSLAAQGRWPWPRRTVTELVTKIAEGQAATIGFDVLFGEAQDNPIAAITAQLADRPEPLPGFNAQLRALQPSFDDDAKFGVIARDHGVVLGFMFHAADAAPTGRLPAPLPIAAHTAWNASSIPALRSYSAPLAAIQTDTPGAFLTTVPDDDGVLRRSPLLLRYGADVYPSLALEMARQFLLLEQVTIDAQNIGDASVIEHIGLGSLRAHTDGQGRALVPYRGRTPAFTFVSASDVLSGTVAPDTFINKLVLIGATALGLGDVVATPLQSVYPGVEVHASLLAGILDGRLPYEPAWARGANVAALIVVGVACAVILPMLNAPLLVALTLLLGGALVSGNFWLWQKHGLVLELVLPLSLLATIAAAALVNGFMTETRRRGLVQDMFGQYVPPELVQQMVAQAHPLSTEGESRTMTVLFADIRGFTTLSETLHPNDLKRLLNQFFDHTTRVIFEQRGTIDKYVGDMIMAFWGAPVTDPQHARHAVIAALKMNDAVAALRPTLIAQGLPAVRIGIGLNTGIMNVGDMGSRFRRAYTVIGDAVNLASRLEGLTRAYNVDIVIGENTRNELDDIVCRRLDRVRVKGKTQPVEVFEPLCMRHQLTADLQRELEQHEEALTLLWNRQWNAAREAFQQLRARSSAVDLYDVYLERVDQLAQSSPPENWDGVYERRTK